MTTVATGLVTRDVAVGEHTLHLHQVGDPALPTILWLHGSGPGVSALSNWEQLITTMPAFHHVAPDVLGFADSSHPDPAPLGTDAFTRLRSQVTLGLLDALGIDRVHVVGNSMGGMIALRSVLAAPQRFDRVILMGSGGTPTPPTPALVQMVTFYQEPTPAAMRALLTSFVHDTALFGDRLDEISENRVAVATRPAVRRSHLATFDMSAGLPTAFTPEELATIPHEVLVIHGRDDRVIPVEASLYYLTNLPNVQLHVLPHAGHWVQIEQVDRFRTQAEVFLGEAGIGEATTDEASTGKAGPATTGTAGTALP